MDRSGIWIALFLTVCLIAGSALAETVELVTYYPSSATASDLHVNSLAVGSDYAGVTPPDGTALIADRLGVGTNNPQGPLHVVGVDGGPSSVLFLPGAGGTLNVGIGMDTFGVVTPNAPLHVRSVITTPAPDILVERNSALPGSNGSPRIGLVDTWQAGTTSATAPAWFVDNVRDNFRVFRQPNINTPGTEMIRVDANGNVGIQNETPAGPAPNGQNGNLDVNDIWLRNGNRWVSQGGGGTPNFDSDWFAVSINERHVFNHSLGQIPARVEMQFSPNASGSPAYFVGMMNYYWDNGYNVEMSSTQFKIFTGDSSVCVYRVDGSGYPGANPSSGYYRFRAWE